MRLHTLRGEYHYLKTKILEEDIAKADMDKRNNKKNYITLYLMDLLYNRTYNIFYSQLKDKIINSNDSKNSPLIVDIDKSWVKYLFDQDKPFTSHTKTESLTASEKEYLKRSTILSWINLISPQLISLSKFPISENTHATFSLNYLRIPFGGLTEQNFWIKYKNLLNGMFIRQYLNKEKVCFGIGYKMYDLELRKNLNLTSTIDYWKQPVNLNFYDKNLKNGFHIGQELECKLGQDFYSNRNKVSIFIGYEYKTIGYLPENIEINEQFKINFGLKINFNQSY